MVEVSKVRKFRLIRGASEKVDVSICRCQM